MRYKVILLTAVILLFSCNAMAGTTSNSYTVSAQVPIAGSLTRYVQISGAPSNAVITNVQAKFSYTAYGVVQNYVSCRFNKGSDPGPYGGVTLVSQGSLPEGNPGTYGYISFSNWNGQSVNANYYFRFATASGSPYAPTIHTIYVQVTYDVSLPPPSLQSPSNGGSLEGPPYQFTWQSVSGAGAYQIKIADNASFNNPVVNYQNISGSATSYQTSVSLNYGQTYYWQMRTLNSSGTQWGTWSQYRSFMPMEVTLPPPTLISPINDETVTSVLLQWQQVTNAGGYELDVDGNQVIINNGSQTSYSPTLGYGSHNWRARTKNSSGVYGDWSGYASFTYMEVTLPPPTLISPINDETVTSVLLQWQQVTNAGGYELDVDGNQVIINNGSQTSYSPTLGYGSHNWRARTKNSSGVYGDWSGYASFTYVEATLPELKINAQPGWPIFTPSGPCTDPQNGSEYRYGPSIIINDDDSIDVWFSSPGIHIDHVKTEFDWIRYNQSTDGGITWLYSWDDPSSVVLVPSLGSADRYSCCDPGVTKFGGYYYIAYTSGNEVGYCNDVFVARSTSATGPFQKWNGSGWGGDDPQPLIDWSCVDPSEWGASEPSFVVKDETLFIYYEWTEVGTRVATSSIYDPNWPSNVTFYDEPAIPKVLGEDSRDVKYIDALSMFVAVAVGERFSGDSYIHVWKSADGFSFISADEIRENLVAYAHNVGISGTCENHIDLNLDNFIAYGYGPYSSNPPNCWPTYLNPISIHLSDVCEGDFEPDGDVDGFDLAIFAAHFGRTDCDQGDACKGDFDNDNDVDGSDLAVFAADFGRTDCPILE